MCCPEATSGRICTGSQGSLGQAATGPAAQHTTAEVRRGERPARGIGDDVTNHMLGLTYIYSRPNIERSGRFDLFGRGIFYPFRGSMRFPAEIGGELRREWP